MNHARIMLGGAWSVAICLALSPWGELLAQRLDPPCPPGSCQASAANQTSFLSPPTLEPIYACSSTLVVGGYVPGAQIRVVVTVGGSTVELRPFLASRPGTTSVNLATSLEAAGLPPQFAEGQVVQARQVLGTASALSSPVAVELRDQFGPPAVIPPLYECGRLLGVSNVEAGMDPHDHQRALRARRDVRVGIRAAGVHVGTSPTRGPISRTVAALPVLVDGPACGFSKPFPPGFSESFLPGLPRVTGAGSVSS
ncbi:MAG: hypothetical protein OHK0013_48770 [Sandaracinaceae bacterium]